MRLPENELIWRAVNGSPNEVCGVITDTGEAIAITNVARQPKHTFEMDTEELLAAYAKHNIIGVYHSHPKGNTEPSSIDRKFAQPGLRQWIVTPQGVYEWEA